jgi:hypothetical protein
LLGAPGADRVAGSWASAWSLLDVFVCAIAALLAWRLLGAAGALAAIAFLLLGYQEAGAPLWSLIAAIGLTLGVRALPGGRLAQATRALRGAALVLLVLVALPFAAAQLRYALYPQLEAGAGDEIAVAAQFQGKDAAAGGANAPVAMNDEIRQAEAPAAPPAMPVESETATPAPAPPPPARHRIEAKASDKANALQSVYVSGTRIDRAQAIEHYSRTTVVQTGGGAPAWNLGSTAWLSWSGPVPTTQGVRLIVAPPWLVRLLRIVLAALLAWLVWRVLRAGGGAPARTAPPLGAAALLVCGLALAAPLRAQEYPSAELLQQLRERLSEPPRCAPRCAGIAAAQVTADGDTIGIALEAHAGERVALPLPRDDATAALQGVRVDGHAEDAVARDADGGLWLALGRGVHRIDLTYSAAADKVALAFPLPPRRVLFHGNGWDAGGLADERLLTETLTLARARAAQASVAGTAAQQFPAYVRVERRLSLGLEWTAVTEVLRLAPARGGFAVDVPLLGGEHVATPGIKVRDATAQVAIGDDALETTWSSTLDKADTLTLTAPPLGARAEVWMVLVSPTWHVAFAGVPEASVGTGDNPDDYRNFEFHPLPGETLTVTITRPAAAQGASRAVDAVNLVTSIGQRASGHVLAFTLRASQGGEQAIALPAGTEVTGASRDGVALNLRALDGRLSVPVLPGTHRYQLDLRSDAAIGFDTRTAPIGLGLPAANVGLTLQLPADRWLLATWGPPVGPAVLYWGELIVMIGVAFALARSRRTRLRFRDWLLLGLGFSTFSWIALLVVVAWLFAFEWRRRGRLPPLRWQFNLIQVALALLTLTAVACLVAAIPQGLLGQPDMHVAGNGSYPQSLRWFADRTTDRLPQAHALSLPLWVYKVLMLAWALWLANALIGWLRDGFVAWTRDGYWRARPAPTPAAETPPPGDVAAG